MSNNEKTTPLTDAEIKKALEYCSSKDMITPCPKDCPMHKYNGDCFDLMQRDILDLINRKDAEIERLQKFKSYFDDLYGCNLEVLGWHENGDVIDFDEFYDSAIADMENAEHHIEYTIKTAKAEAIKEFAERLKQYLLLSKSHDMSVVSLENIDNLLKEMVGDAE